MFLQDGTQGNSHKHWYELFSRGTRDWLRHNEKVREAVRDHLPEVIANSDVLTRSDNRTVQVPVKFLEHYRFTLRNQDEQSGAGQGQAKPGDTLRPAQPGTGGNQRGGGEGEGEFSFVLEFKIDDILDWLWEELQLPNLQPKEGSNVDVEEYVREGWDKRGARSRLDRRRTMKEAIKRRKATPNTQVPISNDDLRFRQLARKRQPSTNAVVFFLLDVSSSMDEHCRKLAKSFFFWALQGIRRQFSHIDTVFIAHSVEAFEFEETDFFQVSGQGGTKSSTALELAEQILQERFDNSQYNSYLFYATDGENFSNDREQAAASLQRLAPQLNFAGYAEVSHSSSRALNTEVGRLWQNLAHDRQRCGSYALSSEADVWPAIKAFFNAQAEQGVEL